MSEDTPDPNESASPVDDIKKQDPEGATTEDQTSETLGDHKVDDLAEARRDDLNTSDDQVAEGKWKSTNDGSGTSETN